MQVGRLKFSFLYMEYAGEAIFPRAIRGGKVLAGVAFDRVDGRDVGSKGNRLQERGSGTSKVLHTSEHSKFLRSGAHKKGIALSLAGFECHA